MVMKMLRGLACQSALVGKDAIPGALPRNDDHELGFTQEEDRGMGCLVSL